MAVDDKDVQNDVIEGEVVDSSSAQRDALEAEPKQEPTPSESSPATRETEVEMTQKHSHKGLWLITTINLLIVITVIAGGYWYWLNYLKVDRANPQIELLEQRYSSLETSVNGITQDVAAVQNTIDAQAETITSLQNDDAQTADTLGQLSQQVELNQLTNEGLSKRIADVAGRRPSDWLLAEADYLVKLAGKKLYLEQDVQAAVMLLKSADVRIADLADTSLLPIRALLAKDIQTLQQVNDVPSTSIALSISALIAQVDALPLDTLKLPDPVAPEEQTAISTDVANWKANLKASWDAIVKDFISVEERTSDVTPFMSGKQQWLAREQLKYALLNAQQAILQDEPALYVQGLQTALDTVITHYQLDNSGVETYIQSIQDLITIDTNQDIPSQLDSQVPLAEVINARIQTLFAGGN